MQWLKNCGKVSGALMRESGAQTACRWGWDADFCKSRYRSILQASNQIVYINPKYSPDCYQKRNIWMVDHSSRVIAVYNGLPGGTRNTIKYAQKQGIDCHNIIKGI